MEGQLPLNRPEICVIGRDHTGTDTPCRQGDQHIKGPVAQLGDLIVFLSSEPKEDLGGFQPLLLRGRQYLAPLTQFKNKLPLSGCSSAAEQFVSTTEEQRMTKEDCSRRKVKRPDRKFSM